MTAHRVCQTHRCSKVWRASLLPLRTVLQGFNLFDEELTIEMGWVVLNMCLGTRDDTDKQFQQALPWRHSDVLDGFGQSVQCTNF